MVAVLFDVSTSDYLPWEVANDEQVFGFVVVDGGITEFSDYLTADCEPVDTF
jgi:hypothetical protein